MTKPELPEWIDKIRERLTEKPSKDAWVHILQKSPNDALALLEHCMKLREALEALKLAKQEKENHGDNPVYRALKQNAWKLVDSAIQHIPQGETK